jgi:hypothetical protein
MHRVRWGHSHARPPVYFIGIMCAEQTGGYMRMTPSPLARFIRMLATNAEMWEMAAPAEAAGVIFPETIAPLCTIFHSRFPTQHNGRRRDDCAALGQAEQLLGEGSVRRGPPRQCCHSSAPRSRIFAPSTRAERGRAASESAAPLPPSPRQCRAVHGHPRGVRHAAVRGRALRRARSPRRRFYSRTTLYVPFVILDRRYTGDRAWNYFSAGAGGGPGERGPAAAARWAERRHRAARARPAAPPGGEIIRTRPRCIRTRTTTYILTENP